MKSNTDTTTTTIHSKYTPLRYTTTTTTATATATTPLRYATLHFTTLYYQYTTTTLQLQLQLQHYNYSNINYSYSYNYTTIQLHLQLQLHCTTLHHTTSSSCGWGDRCNPLQPFQKAQLQPPFGPSVDSLCHPGITTTHLTYSFLSLRLSPLPCAVLVVQCIVW